MDILDLTLIIGNDGRYYTKAFKTYDECYEEYSEFITKNEKVPIFAIIIGREMIIDLISRKKYLEKKQM